MKRFITPICLYTLIISPSLCAEYLAGAYSSTGDVSNGFLQIDTPATGSVYGGFTSAAGAHANNNTLVINDDVKFTPYSQVLHNSIAGGFVWSGGQANNNTVIINGGEIGSTNETGGYEFYIYGGKGSNGASNNTVILSGGTISGTIVAGDSMRQQYGKNDNTVVVGKDVNLSSNTKLVGVTNAITNHFSGNTLEIHQSDLRLRYVSGFNNIYFVLPSDIKANDTVLSVSNHLSLDNIQIGVSLASGDNYSLKEGDSIVLIDSVSTYDANFKKINLFSDMLKIEEKLFLDYDFDIFIESEQLKATVINKSAAEESKAPSEAVAASVAVLTAGADVVAGAALENALSVAATSGVGNFGSISGGSYNYKTGSDVDVLGLSGVAGIAKAFDTEFGNAMAGFFVEAGYGKHETHNDFSFGSITGKGNSTYSGVGLLGCAEFEKMKGVYAEASMRLGMINSDWSSDDLGMDVSYSTGSMYYGLHLGAGYKNQLNDNLGYELYAKYFFAHQNSNDVTISGDKFEFDAVNSHRVRLGSKLSLTSFEQINPYLGVAWEHEFDGEARATVYGLDVPAPTLAGDTGILELGIRNKTTEDSAFSFEFAVQGYFGVRTGIGGVLQGVYKF